MRKDLSMKKAPERGLFLSDIARDTRSDVFLITREAHITSEGMHKNLSKNANRIRSFRLKRG